MTFTVCTTVSKLTGDAFLWDTKDCLSTDEIRFTRCSIQVREKELKELEFLALLTFLNKQVYT